MKIAFFEFGNVSNCLKMMNNGLTLLENNLIELNKFLNNPNIDIDIYILTEKNLNHDFDEYINNIKNIFERYKISIKAFNYWNDLSEFHKIDSDYNQKYKDLFNVEKYGFKKGDNIWGIDTKDNFNPGNLWFRRYLNFYLYDVNDQKEHYDLIALTRLFSTKIIYFKSLINFDLECLYFVHDFLFIGNYENIKKLLQFGANALFYNENNDSNFPALFDDINFINYSQSINNIIYNHIFCSEIQILYYIYKNFYNYKFIGFDFYKYISKNLESENIHELVYSTNYYINSNLKKIIHDENDNYLLIFISR